jgi:hypothetical protein
MVLGYKLTWDRKRDQLPMVNLNHVTTLKAMVCGAEDSRVMDAREQTEIML